MFPFDPEHVLETTSAEVKRYLLIALKQDAMPTTRHTLLKTASERLYAALQLFDVDDAASMFEECYLPLFDALAFVNYAMRVPYRWRDGVTGALDALAAESVKGGA